MIDLNLKLGEELQCRRNEWLIFTTRMLETSIMVSVSELDYMYFHLHNTIDRDVLRSL